MNRTISAVSILFCLVLALLVEPTVAAQAPFGGVEATVVDMTGATWPDAVVAAVNTNTFVVYKAHTNGQGVASIEIPEGQYVLIGAPSNQCYKPAMERLRVAAKETIHVKLVLSLDDKYKKCGEPIT